MPAPTFDPARLDQASGALLDVFAPDVDRSLAIALGNLRDAHAAGRIRFTGLLALRQVVRKAVRAAWADAVCLPLARSDSHADRQLLVALPEELPFGDHAAFADTVAASAAEIPGLPPRTLERLVRADAYLRAVPTLLASLDALDGLDRAFEFTDVSVKERRRIDTACKRLRLAFGRDVAPLVHAAAAVAHKAPLGCVGHPAFPCAGPILAKPPKGGVRRRDRSGVQWMESLAAALVSDVVTGVAAPLMAELLAAHPGMALEKAVTACEGTRLRFTARMACNDAGVALHTDADLGTGLLWSVIEIMEPGGKPRPVDREELDALLRSGQEDVFESTAPAP